MKAPAFAYTKPASFDAVFDLLDEYGDDARILAGGQSLLAALNLRLFTPALLIDITGLPGLSGIAVSGNTLRIGALTTQREVECSPLIARHLPLIAQAMPWIAHAAIRNVGTFGGSIALADPAAELPACSVALDARFVLKSRHGERRVAAKDFFRNLYTTDLKPGELLVAGEFPLPPAGYRGAFLELARRRGDFAIVGLAAHAKVQGGGIGDARLVFFGVDNIPVVAQAAAAAVADKRISPDVIAAAQTALEHDLSPFGDNSNTPQTKLHLAKVLTGRALAALLA